MKTAILFALAMFLTALTAGSIPSRPVPLPIPVAQHVRRKHKRGRK